MYVIAVYKYRAVTVTDSYQMIAGKIFVGTDYLNADLIQLCCIDDGYSFPAIEFYRITILVPV